MSTTVTAAPSVNLETASAEDRVKWAVEQFGDGLVMTTSFGIQAAVMLHLVTRVAPKIPVIFIDTGYLFPETYRFAKDLTDKLGLNIKKYVPAMTAAEQEALYGKQWEQGIDGLKRYNFINKVEPMDRAGPAVRRRRPRRDGVAGGFAAHAGEQARGAEGRAAAEQDHKGSSDHRLG